MDYIYIFTFYFADNPLICDCDLRWFSRWLQNLKDKDDEMMSKKRTVCTMMNEHREYSVQNLPLERMGCVASAEKTSSPGNLATKIVGIQILLTVGLVILL